VTGARDQLEILPVPVLDKAELINGYRHDARSQGSAVRRNGRPNILPRSS
jgi:hypothetical protein